jgi:two-component system, LytTR family, sensor kinase
MFKYLFRSLLFAFLGILTWSYLNYGLTGKIYSIFRNPALLVFVIIGSVISGWIISAGIRLIERKFTWRNSFFLRLIFGVITQLIVLLAIPLLLLFITGKITGNLTLLFESYQDPVVKYLILLSFGTIILSISEFTIYSYNDFSHSQILRVKLEREQMELQFEALKSQLSPHYLFNALNTISSLIYKDPASSELFIRRLAHTYQYILQTRDIRLITLEKELEFIRSYDYLLKVKYGDGMAININIPNEFLGKKVPPLTLQMLVENAFKHNVISEEEPLIIDIYKNGGDEIVVKNTITVKPGTIQSFNIGLENIKKRYHYFSDQPIRINEGETYEVHLPLLEESLY